MVQRPGGGQVEARWTAGNLEIQKFLIKQNP
jgi:hypothetical protein